MLERRLGRGPMVLTAIGLALACGGGQSAGPARPRVAVSIFPLYDVARRIAGDRIEVVCILPPGRSEHGYDPTPQEMARVANARAGLVVGLEMDEWAERIVRGASDSAPEIVRLGPELDPRRMSAHEVGMELAEQEHELHDEGHQQRELHDPGEHRDEREDHEQGEHRDHEQGEHRGHEQGEDRDHEEGEHRGHEQGEDRDHEEGEHRDEDRDDEQGEHRDHEQGEHRDEDRDHEQGERREDRDHDERGHHEDGDRAEREGGHEGAHHHHHGGFDPHFWLDPGRMQRASSRIAEIFARIDPGGADGYRQRASQVTAQIGAADSEIQARARRWRRRTIVTFHGSFGYFAERFGLRIAAVLEPFPGREPTPRYLEEVLGAIRGSGAAALFSEPQLDPRPARVIAQQAGVPLFELDPIGGTGSITSYEALLRSNANVLEQALR